MSFDVDTEWLLFMEGQAVDDGLNSGRVTEFSCKAPVRSNDYGAAPDPRDLTISTISKSRFLNTRIDSNDLFWAMPLISYTDMRSGVVKKQLFIRSNSRDELDAYMEKYSEMTQGSKDAFIVTETQLKHVDTPDAKHMKFMDTRSLAVGTCKKNITNPKKKNSIAFSNCIVMYVRYPYCGRYHETHVKVFDKGSFEATGMYDVARMVPLLAVMTEILRPFYPTIEFLEMGRSLSVCDDDQSAINRTVERCVLINSGFSCNFPVDKEALSVLLTSEYSIDSTLTDGYPGLKCKYYIDLDVQSEHQTGQLRQSDIAKDTEELKLLPYYVIVNFMVFGTGECLVSGHASEPDIRFVHVFVRDLLHKHYADIVAIHGPGPRKKPARIAPKKRLHVTREFAAKHCPRGKKRVVEPSRRAQILSKEQKLAKRRALASAARGLQRKLLYAVPSNQRCKSISDCAESDRFHGMFRRCDVSLLPSMPEKKSHKKQLPIVPVEIVEGLSRNMMNWLIR